MKWVKLCLVEINTRKNLFAALQVHAEINKNSKIVWNKFLDSADLNVKPQYLAIFNKFVYIRVYTDFMQSLYVACLFLSLLLPFWDSFYLLKQFIELLV